MCLVNTTTTTKTMTTKWITELLSIHCSKQGSEVDGFEL